MIIQQAIKCLEQLSEHCYGEIKRYTKPAVLQAWTDAAEAIDMGIAALENVRDTAISTHNILTINYGSDSFQFTCANGEKVNIKYSDILDTGTL